jgi:predicted TIM-barrel fold metal-dependent hydrolase
MVTDAQDRALPIKVDPTSNGEFRPVPLTKALTQANALAHEQIGAHAKRLGVGRRAFLQSLCAAATTLGTFNEAFAAQGNTGGSFRLPKEAAYESAAARSALAGDEFIFDVQTHLVDPAGTWRANAGKYWEQILAHFPHGACGERDPVDCFSADQFIKHVFMDSDTDLAVLSFVPELPERNPLSLKEAERVRALVERMEGAKRLFLHAMVVPNAPAVDPLKFMEDAVARYPIKAWKSYTQWGPEGVGWELDDPAVGIPFLEKARALGVRTICIHKGLFFSGFPERYGRCADVGRAAKLYPDVNFIIYHSGFETGHREGPFDPARATHGVDALIKSLLDNGIAPNTNVYAELGSTWRFVMRDPTMAAHLLGKLLVHVGPDNVLWGTDSIWYGSPQDQIQAFRSFEIAPKLIEAYRYRELTPRLKAKIFGINGARVYGVDVPAERKKTEADPIGVRKQAYRERAEPVFETFGPKTDREFEALAAERKGLPT